LYLFRWMPKTPCPLTSLSIVLAGRSLLKLKVRSNRRVGQAQPTQAKGVRQLQVRRDNPRLECNLLLKALQRPRLNLIGSKELRATARLITTLRVPALATMSFKKY